MAGIEPALPALGDIPPVSGQTISRPVERQRVIYRCVPRLMPLVLLLAEFITIPRPSVATYVAMTGALQHLLPD